MDISTDGLSKVGEVSLEDRALIWDDYIRVKGEQSLEKREQERLASLIRGEFYQDSIPGSVLRDEPIYRLKLKKDYRIIANLLLFTVADMAAERSQIPVFDAPATKDTKAGIAQAQLFEDVINGTWEESGRAGLLYRGGWYTHGYGWAIYGAQFDPKANRARVVLFNPRHCYPVFEMGNDRKLNKLFVSFRVDEDQLKEKYENYEVSGTSNQLYKKQVELVTYYDKNFKMVFADGQYLDGVKHEYGFLPFVVVPNTYVDGRIGISDVAPVVGLNVAANEFLNLNHELMVRTIRNPILIKADELPTIDIQGDNTMVLLPEGDAERMPPVQGPLPEIFHQVNTYKDMIDSISGTSSARRGQRSGMYVSGGGLKGLQEPMGARLDALLRIQAEEFAELNKYIGMLYEIHTPSKEVQLFGRMSQKGPFSVSFKGKDIKGFYRTNVIYMPALRGDSSQRNIQLMQMYKDGTISKRLMMTYSDVPNPDREISRIEEEMLSQAQLEGKVKAETEIAYYTALKEAGVIPGMGFADQQPLPEGGQPPADAMMENLALESGRLNPMAGGMLGGGPPLPGAGAPSPLPEGGSLPPELAGMMGGGMPPGMPPAGMPPEGMPPEGVPGMPPLPSLRGDEVSDQLVEAPTVADAIRAIPKGKLKGQVFLVGEIVQVGSTTKQIDIFYTFGNDKKTLIDHLPQWSGGKRLDLSPVKSEQEIYEPYMDVSPGTTGYEVKNLNHAIGAPADAPQPEGLPPIPGLAPLGGPPPLGGGPLGGPV